MVDREVDVPVWVVLGRSCGLCWRLGPLLGPMLAVLGRDQGEKRPKPGNVAQTLVRAGVGPPEAAEPAEAPRALSSRYLFLL